MESPQQQLKYTEPTALKVGKKAEQASLAELPPVIKINQPTTTTNTQVSTFLVQPPDYIGGLFNDYKQPIVTVALSV